MANANNGCKFCRNRCELFDSGMPCPTQADVDEARVETFESHEPEIDLNHFDFGRGPSIDSSNLDLIPDCNIEDDDDFEDETAKAYLEGEDFDEDSGDIDPQKSGRADSKGHLKYKHDLQDERALAAKAARFEKGTTSKDFDSAHIAKVKAHQAYKGLQKLEARRAKRGKNHPKAKQN